MHAKTPLSPMPTMNAQGALDFWTRGPWMFVDFGLKFARAWQDTWLRQMRLMPSALPATTRGATPSLEAQIAARQGHKLPHLGCLQGVEVVGGPSASERASLAKPAGKAAEKTTTPRVAAPKKPVSAPSKAAAHVTGKAVAKMPVKKPAVKLAKAASKPAAKKPAQRAVVQPAKPKAVANAPVNAAAGQSATLPPPSVTSMLAMQARTLSKAVGKKPAAPASVKKTGSKKA